MDDGNVVLLTPEQAKVMRGWVCGCLGVINENHADFQGLIIEQYPDMESCHQDSIVVNCVCQAIMRAGIEYLHLISDQKPEFEVVKRLLLAALNNELGHDASHVRVPSTKQ